VLHRAADFRWGRQGRGVGRGVGGWGVGGGGGKACRDRRKEKGGTQLLLLLLLLLLLFPTASLCCRNYSADATAFVITYPIDSDPAKRTAALAWEAAFIQLANNELRGMAAAANLSFAFQAER